MRKHYLEESVWHATQNRIAYLFDNFQNVLVAFSGGKDSGVCLNLCYEYARAHERLDQLAIYHLDYEAQYQATTDYVSEVFNGYEGVRKFWLCLPFSAQCAVNMQQDHWTPWDTVHQKLWVRSMPDHPAVINENNVPWNFKKEQWDYDVQNDFCSWFAQENGSTAAVIGIRADESLSRLSAITSRRKVNRFENSDWIVSNPDCAGLANAYPIYDWRTDDIWIANGKNGWSYNRLYDLFWKAGLNIDQMRVASPFNDCAIQTLAVYKAVEPDTWAKLLGRVNGVNFAAIYGRTTAMGWKSVKLPPGHTWKSYLEFLLSTLPKDRADAYRKKFQTSIEFWKKRGGCLSAKTIEELAGQTVFEVGESTNYKTDKLPVRFPEYPDDLDVTDFRSVPTYKRMCMCILRNDHTCKTMGFSQTKKELELRKEMIKKYENIIGGNNDDITSVWN